MDVFALTLLALFSGHVVDIDLDILSSTQMSEKHFLSLSVSILIYLGSLMKLSLSGSAQSIAPTLSSSCVNTQFGVCIPIIWVSLLN